MKKRSFLMYYSGNKDNSNHGVGIIVPANIKASFTPINGRICKLTAELEGERNLTFISAYAPTLPESKKSPEVREDFYNVLDSVINKVNKRDFLVIGGDLNAKTGTGYPDYPANMGRFGKGEMNENGEELLDFCARNNLFITNTMFRHRAAHVTTWTSKIKHENFKHSDGKPRKNPYRNQIDYIITKKEDVKWIQDSRSHFSNTDSDHKMVIMRTMLFTTTQSSKSKSPRIDYDKLRNPEIKREYKENVRRNMEKSENTEDVQEKWNVIVKSNHEAAKEILGYKQNYKRSANPEIKRRSEHQKKLRLQIDSTTDKKQEELRQERRENLNEIHKILTKEETDKIDNQVEDILRSKEDSTRMYEVLRQIKRGQEKKPLLIETENGLTTNEETQVREIAQHFHNALFDKEATEIPEIKPSKMQIPFSCLEIEKAIKSLRNNRSPGIDEIKAEQLKHGPTEVNQEIAHIFNKMAETGKHPEEINTGILTPLQKPKKKQGPCENLRPIILLSMLRKILAIIMIRRTCQKILAQVSKSQAAYQDGRSTTEQVLACKMMAEKAVSSKNYTTHILLMDMSKAFDTVDRAIILTELNDILQPDELHIIKLLIGDVKLKVKVGDTYSEPFHTNTGTPQGDCLSPILFIWYLARTLNPQPRPEIQDHQYSQPTTQQQDHQYSLPATSQVYKKPPHQQDHAYANNTEEPTPEERTITPRYADDISWIVTGSHDLIQHYKETVPPKLKERNLHCNHEKDEEYTITRHGNENWKNCKYLGSKLGTEEDFKNRKQNAILAMEAWENIWKHKRIPLEQKHKYFKTFVEPVFLYNSELWTMSATLRGRINSFQRRLLRRAIHIRYPKKISTQELKKRLKYEDWDLRIDARRLRMWGHMVRLQPDTPVQQAMLEARRQVKRPQGHPPNTWIKTMETQLLSIVFTWEEAVEKAQYRDKWRFIAWGGHAGNAGYAAGV